MDELHVAGVGGFKSVLERDPLIRLPAGLGFVRLLDVSAIQAGEQIGNETYIKQIGNETYIKTTSVKTTSVVLRNGITVIYEVDFDQFQKALLEALKYG